MDWCQRLMENEVGYTGCSEKKEVPTCSFEDLGYNSLNTSAGRASQHLSASCGASESWTEGSVVAS